jgi:hypothetical protein
VRVRAVQKARGRIASPEYSPRSASCNCWKKRASQTLRWSERPAIARRPKLSALFFEHESRFRSCSCHLGEPPPLTVDSSRTIPKRQGSPIRELPLRHQDACAIGTMLSVGGGGRMPRAFLACLPWLLPDNLQKVFIEVPSALVPDRRSAALVRHLFVSSGKNAGQDRAGFLPHKRHCKTRKRA